jgi:hypothetical protein
VSKSIERFHRIVREPPAGVIEPPNSLVDSVDRLADDPRRPRTAIARWATRLWAELHYEREEGEILPSPSPTIGMVDKETIERPQHFPTDWGLAFIPSPGSISGWGIQDSLITDCYTSLSVPRPFDPTLHGTIAGAVGFGWMGYQGNPFPDNYDIVTRRGGGPRGGFSWTTGPTEGNYPTGILPSPTFDLGKIGFSNGGWNPEGLKWTNRPRRVRLQGLRNGWAHRVMFVRSRKVMFRNLYGPVSEDEATPKAPTVVLNGSLGMTGVRSVRVRRAFNAPATVTIDLNSVAGRRSGVAKLGDTVQIFAAPRNWAFPPCVFTGFISDIEEDDDKVTLVGLDTLGYLTKDIILTNPNYQETDAGAVIRDIIGNSSYGPPLGKISTETRVILPAGLDLSGKTRLAAAQTVLDIVNNTPNRVLLQAGTDGFINLIRLREVDDANLTPYIAGRIPRTSVPQDLYPTSILRDEGDLDFPNKVTVKNPELDIEVTEPRVEPNNPIHIIVNESAATDEATARFFAQQILSQAGTSKARWLVTAIPERFDIMPGQVVDFASKAGSLAGRQMVFNVDWVYSTDGSEINLTVGRQAADLVAAMRHATGVSL